MFLISFLFVISLYPTEPTSIPYDLFKLLHGVYTIFIYSFFEPSILPYLVIYKQSSNANYEKFSNVSFSKSLK
mgnify:CR=1 FL=1